MKGTKLKQRLTRCCNGSGGKRIIEASHSAWIRCKILQAPCRPSEFIIGPILSHFDQNRASKSGRSKIELRIDAITSNINENWNERETLRPYLNWKRLASLLCCPVFSQQIRGIPVIEPPTENWSVAQSPMAPPLNLKHTFALIFSKMVRLLYLVWTSKITGGEMVNLSKSSRILATFWAQLHTSKSQVEGCPLVTMGAK